MAAQWGGTGIPKSMENKVQYKSSLEHFSQYCQDNNVVVETTAHLFADNGYAKLNNVVNATFIENNPLYLGQKGIDNYLKGIKSNKCCNNITDTEISIKNNGISYVNWLWQ